MRLKISHLFLSIGMIMHISHMNANSQDLLIQSFIAANVLYQKALELQGKINVIVAEFAAEIAKNDSAEFYIAALHDFVIKNNLQNNDDAKKISLNFLQTYITHHAHWAGNDLIINTEEVKKGTKPDVLINMFKATMTCFNDPTYNFHAPGGFLSNSAGEMKLSKFLVDHLGQPAAKP